MDRFVYRSPPVSFLGDSPYLSNTPLEPELPKSLQGNDPDSLFSGRDLVGSDPDLALRFKLGLALVP